MIKVLLPLLCVGVLSAQPQLEMLPSPTQASLRGLSAVSDDVCWASGSEGTVIRTTDGGQSWEDVSPKGYDSLQFRDIHSMGPDTALLLSAGLPAVVLKTINGGQSWKLCYRNDQTGVFFDAFDFWDQQEGLAFSDAPGRHLLVIHTIDGGDSWEALDSTSLPEVGFKQGGFAASGTCLKTFGQNSVLIGLGGTSATALLSKDKGKSWTKVELPLDEGAASKGIYSFDFLDNQLGLCVGGDYRGDSNTTHSAAITKDGGLHWQVLRDEALQGHYLSCVLFLDDTRIIAASRTGISWSEDLAESWKRMEGSFYSASKAEGTVWLSGPQGRLAKWNFSAQ